jgi:hypothetical protein
MSFLSVSSRRLSTGPGAESRTARRVAGEDVMGLLSSRGRSRSAVVSMRPLRLQSYPGTAAFFVLARVAAYRQGWRGPVRLLFGK